MAAECVAGAVEQRGEGSHDVLRGGRPGSAGVRVRRRDLLGGAHLLAHRLALVLVALGDDERELLTLLHSLFRHDPKNVLFAVMVPKPKPKPKSEPVSDINATPNNANSESTLEWEMAGCLGILRASPYTLSAELGPAMPFTRFQRTHVTSNAIGLALRYCLNLPSDIRFPGLGMRRVEWQANPLNVASVRAAERMGFKKEGIIRWTLPLPPGRSGYEPREGDPLKDRKGRDSVYLSVCCDDWEAGGRDKVEAAMEIRRP